MDSRVELLGLGMFKRNYETQMYKDASIINYNS